MPDQTNLNHLLVCGYKEELEKTLIRYYLKKTNLRPDFIKTLKICDMDKERIYYSFWRVHGRLSFSWQTFLSQNAVYNQHKN